MKLDTSKITDGVAVHCSKKEYVRPLFEAMGKQNSINQALRVWEGYYTDETCYIFAPHTSNSNPWEYSKKGWYESEGNATIPFEDLIIHVESKKKESNLIKALHAVGVGDWLNEGVKFEFRGHKYKVFDDNVYLCDNITDWLQNVKVLLNMISHPEEIKPLPRWTPEEQKMAEKDSFRFKSVEKSCGGFTFLHSAHGECVRIPDASYPSLRPGERESLEEIVRGGE